MRNLEKYALDREKSKTKGYPPAISLVLGRNC